MSSDSILVETRCPSPIGELVLQAGPRGLRYAAFARPMMGRLAHAGRPTICDAVSDANRFAPPASVEASLKPARPRCPIGGDDASAAVASAHQNLDQALLELGEYFAGRRRVFSVRLDLAGTAFQLSVWNALLAVPFGDTITYRALAAAADRPNAVRAAGAANGANPISIIVPCHRVVGSDGSLTGYAGGIEAKRFLIELEAAYPNLHHPASQSAERRPPRPFG